MRFHSIFLQLSLSSASILRSHSKIGVSSKTDASLSAADSDTDAIVPPEPKAKLGASLLEQLFNRQLFSSSAKTIPANDPLKPNSSTSTDSGLWGDSEVRVCEENSGRTQDYNYVQDKDALKVPEEFSHILFTDDGVTEYVLNEEWSLSDPFASDILPRKRSFPSTKKWFSMNDDVPIGLVLVAPINDVDETIEIILDDHPIYMVGKTGVYSIISPGALRGSVIKYQMFCESTHDMYEPMVNEAFFLKLLEKEPVPITHKLIYLSGPFKAPVDSQASQKKIEATECRPASDVDSPDTQSPLNEGMVRYMITELTGDSLQQLARDKFRAAKYGGFAQNVADAFRLTAQMILVLKKLHSRNIVHGDAHWGNFVRSLHTDSLILMDFGRAHIIDLEEYRQASLGYTLDIQYPGHEIQNSEEEHRLLIHYAVSMWETYFALPSFRDDVYRVIQTLAILLHGSKYLEYLYKLSAKEVAFDDDMRYHYYRYKHYRNIFETPMFYRDEKSKEIKSVDFFLDEILDPKLASEARMRLDRILHSVRATKIYEYPKYDDILEELIALIKLTRIGKRACSDPKKTESIDDIVRYTSW